MLGIMAGMDQKDCCSFYWQWHVQGLVCWPLHLATCSFTWLAGPDAQLLGRYEPEGLFRVLHCRSHSCCVQRQVLWSRGAENCGFSAVAIHRWSSIFLSWCTGRFPWSCCSADHRDSPVAPVHVVDAPGLLIVLVSLSWRRGGLPWFRLVLDQSVFRVARQGGRCLCCIGRAVHPVVAQRLCLTVQLLDAVIDFPVAQVVQFVFFVVAQR